MAKGEKPFTTPDGLEWRFKKEHLSWAEANEHIRRGAAVLHVRGPEEADEDGRYEGPVPPGSTRPVWIAPVLEQSFFARLVFPPVSLFTTKAGERLVRIWTDA